MSGAYNFPQINPRYYCCCCCYYYY